MWVEQEVVPTPINCFDVRYGGDYTFNSEMNPSEFYPKCMSVLDGYEFAPGYMINNMFQQGESLEDLCSGTGTINGSSKDYFLHHYCLILALQRQCLMKDYIQKDQIQFY